MVLGVGILMGAYWAYETLNFGGYWNWDPVENAVYVPWLVLVASYHTMITYRKSSTALKTSVILVVATFLLILYSTFLTRSGILGESSVHSFTDLGLSGQLLIYFLVFTLLSVALIVYRWKQIPISKQEASTYSREFWIFVGATTLCLMGFQVLVATSFPVYNSILNGIGIESNMALPADQVSYYTKFQLWFAIVVAVLSGTGQFFWWRKMDPQKLKETLMGPILATLVLSALAMWITNITQLPYIVLLVASIYSVVANAKILWGLKKDSWHLSGGSFAHIVIALMLIGIRYY
jgi:cytochrome c-type biogenesis protein CcmF